MEYSLSIDNLFIFIIIMAKFAVPRELQQYALMIGIVMALVMRAIFIAVGAAAISNFSWVFYLFGLFLVYTAVKLAKEGARGRGRASSRRTSSSRSSSAASRPPRSGTAASCSSQDDGKRMITPMFIVIITLGTTDLLFALDSIPAIFGITKEPYLVLTANIFALMGLRQLYFLIGGLLQRLIYLSYGLAFLLAFIGVKLFLHALHENELPFINGGEHISTRPPEIPIWLSLVVIVATLAVTAVLSLWVSSRMSRRGAGRRHRAAPRLGGRLTEHSTRSPTPRPRDRRRSGHALARAWGLVRRRASCAGRGRPGVRAQQEPLLGGAAVVVGVVAVIAERVARLDRDRWVPLEHHRPAAYAVR